MHVPYRETNSVWDTKRIREVNPMAPRYQVPMLRQNARLPPWPAGMGNTPHVQRANPLTLGTSTRRLYSVIAFHHIGTPHAPSFAINAQHPLSRRELP